MSLDKCNSKLLVEIKKLHVPNEEPATGNSMNTGMPNTIAELDLVNGGEDAQPARFANA